LTVRDTFGFAVGSFVDPSISDYVVNPLATRPRWSAYPQRRNFITRRWCSTRRRGATPDGSYFRIRVIPCPSVAHCSLLNHPARGPAISAGCINLAPTHQFKYASLSHQRLQRAAVRLIPKRPSAARTGPPAMLAPGLFSDEPRALCLVRVRWVTRSGVT